ncbi:hypothetical protein SAMN05443543_10599 [Flavobacterium flevense]|uniref:Macroglobulin domain-containing protein n=1 Tax=Flavobacterium flevense TaxID=983 RepID=A0A4Y4AXN3_9FLAO|nr:hypothetical protein [Flavobacterium flevense]GEC71354.1 hypothetical protein FFL01_08930 [Flavobacterium flevense]SHL80543.1 hypothetical protein SAMN05443543_10599 [Flavobacterium flevense]
MQVKNPILIIVLTLLLFYLFTAVSYSQTSESIADAIAEKVQVLTQNQNLDNVYLQTSKTIYETEEDLWFKGYVLDAQSFIPSNRSKILFVQLVEDASDKVVWQKKYEIENGFVNGHLFLESALIEGNYTLSAYSSNSFTKEPGEFYALKKIKVVQTINQNPTVVPVEKDSIIHFTSFPEGGQLVSGINSNLAFKSVNSKGLPVAVSGTLFENNTPLVDFKSSHAGMGLLTFTPDNNKKYHIQLSEPTSDKIYAIAPVASSGKVLRLLRNTKETLTFKVTQSDGLKEERVYLRLQIRGVVYSIATGLLKKELTIKIPIKELPQGIAEVTLFNENALPIAERLVYVNQEQQLTIQTELDKSSYTTREKAKLKIKVTDQNGQPIVAHLGLSIYDGIYQNKQDVKNIQTHYLLSTQLKGNIYNPVYYFNEQNKNRNQALDLLMLTQGWRSYVWNEANLKELGNAFKPIIFEEIKGKVHLQKPDKKATTVIGEKGMTVFSADESKGSDFMLTDTTGVFTIIPNDLKKGEGGYTYIKLMSAQKPKYTMTIKDFSFETINNECSTKTLLYPLAKIEKRNTQVVSPFTERESINKLKEVTITSKKKGVVFRDKYIGKLDSLYKAQNPTADFVCHDNVLNCELHKGCPGDRKRPIEGEKYTTCDGLKWLKGSGPCGGYFISGHCNEITYHYPELTEAQLLEMFNIVMIEGYYGKKVFYEAVYDEVTITDSTPDYRNTLFWKPDIITDDKGEATISFFCSDINSLFFGNIEGVSGEGLLGREAFQFNVKKSE